MTPKEKAWELRDKMKSCLFSDGLYDAKQCALIAVDEILELHSDAADVFESDRDLRLNETSWEYWQEVKYEIEKL